MRYSTSYKDPRHKMRELLCFCLFWIQSQTRDRARVCTDSPTSHKVSTDVAWKGPPDAGLQKTANYSTLIVGLAGTGDWTQATCVVGSGTNHSAIHYDSESDSESDSDSDTFPTLCSKVSVNFWPPANFLIIRPGPNILIWLALWMGFCLVYLMKQDREHSRLEMD
jgi:hypothetical protein